MSPQKQHSSLARYVCDRLNRFAEPARLGEAFPELRCSYGGRSIVPDVAFLLEAHIEVDHRGAPENDTPIPPDIHRGDHLAEAGLRPRPTRSSGTPTAHGCALGWLVHPDRETIDVYRPDAEPVRLGIEEIIEGEPVLPGFRLPVAEVFGWLRRRHRPEN